MRLASAAPRALASTQRHSTGQCPAIARYASHLQVVALRQVERAQRLERAQALETRPGRAGEAAAAAQAQLRQPRQARDLRHRGVAQRRLQPQQVPDSSSDDIKHTVLTKQSDTKPVLLNLPSFSQELKCRAATQPRQALVRRANSVAQHRPQQVPGGDTGHYYSQCPIEYGQHRRACEHQLEVAEGNRARLAVPLAATGLPDAGKPLTRPSPAMSCLSALCRAHRLTARRNSRSY